MLGLRRKTEGELLRAVIEATRLLVLVVDTNGTVQTVNTAVERATGLTREACMRPVWELAAAAEERAGLQHVFAPFRAEALPGSLVFHLVNETASRVVDWDVRVIDDDPTPYVVLIGVDLSERLAYARRLSESDELRQLILDHLPGVLWATDDKLQFTFGAGRDLAALGLASNQMLGSSIFSYFHTTDVKHPVIAAHLLALDGKPNGYETRWHDRVFQTRLEPLSDRNGVIIGCIGFAVDVTDLRDTVQALQTSEGRLRRLIESNIIGVIVWDANGKILEANDAFLGLLGYTRDELVSGSLSWRAITSPEWHASDDRALADLIAKGACAPFEKEYIAKDGSRVPVLVGVATFDEPTRALTSGVAFILDLREQVRLRRARDQLLVEEQKARVEAEIANARLRLLVEGSNRLSKTMRIGDTLQTLTALVVPELADWSLVVHRGWNGGPSLTAFCHADPSKRKLLARLEETLPDADMQDGTAPVVFTDGVALYEDITLERSSGALATFPLAKCPLLRSRDPEQLRLLEEIGVRSLLCVPIPGRTGVDAVLMLVSATEPHRYGRDDILVATDLAHRAATSLENGRLLAEALDAVRARDDFLAVAAHELRTPLSSLLLHIQMLGRTLDSDAFVARATRADEATFPPLDGARRGAKSAETYARRLAVLVDRLLDVSRLASGSMVVSNDDLQVEQVVRQLVAGMAPELKIAGCRVEVHTPPYAVTARWDRGRIEQVLTNLLSNAMKFGAGSPIEVDVEAAPTHARISVRDHGIGISQQDQARIFGRFERAVSSRHFGGLGLGLYVSAQIIRAHQGSIHVESEPGKGACFIVDLPRYPGESAAREGANSATFRT